MSALSGQELRSIEIEHLCATPAVVCQLIDFLLHLNIAKRGLDKFELKSLQQQKTKRKKTLTELEDNRDFKQAIADTTKQPLIIFFSDEGEESKAIEPIYEDYRNDIDEDWLSLIKCSEAELFSLYKVTEAPTFRVYKSGVMIEEL